MTTIAALLLVAIVPVVVFDLAARPTIAALARNRVSSPNMTVSRKITG